MILFSRIFISLLALLLVTACRSEAERHIVGTWITFSNDLNIKTAEISTYYINYTDSLFIYHDTFAHKKVEDWLTVSPIFGTNCTWEAKDTIIEDVLTTYYLVDQILMNNGANRDLAESLLCIDKKTYEAFEGREKFEGQFRPRLKYQRIYTSLWGVE